MRVLYCSILLSAALAVPGAIAQTPSPSPTTDTTTTAPEPTGQLVSEPPGVEADAPAAPVEPATPWQRLEPLLDDVNVTDLVIAFCALLMTLALLRVASGVGGVRKALTARTEDNRKTIDAMQKAADAASRSAESADRAAGAVLNSVERQLRAYVTVRQFIQAPMKDERGLHGWLLHVAWQNTGQTPTRGFRYWAMLREFERAIPEDFEFTPSGLKDFAGGELGSSSSVNSPPLFVSPQLISKLQDGSRKVLLLGQADYEDVIGSNTSHVTRFCVEVMLMNDPGGANGSPFSFTYHPKHNTIT